MSCGAMSTFDTRLHTRSMDFFFFSSRRRHTRCSRDWSSDVCSSDLQRLEISSAPSGAESFHDFANESPIESHFEVGISNAFFFKSQRKRSDLAMTRGRSEEHTSELQSRLHFVCRLLLEKKKKQYDDNPNATTANLRLAATSPNPQI